VRDGFYFWAFLLGPLWMLWRRLWLVLVIYLVVTAAIQAALWTLGVSGVVKFAVGFLIAVLVGCEAGTLRRWSLRRRWTNVGLVVAPNQEMAGTALLRVLVGDASLPQATAAALPPAMHAPASHPRCHGPVPRAAIAAMILRRT
jgi:hypothetical protein